MVNPTRALSEPTEFTILSGSTESALRHLGGRVPCGLFTPSAWTAADISFSVSYDGSTFLPLYDAAGTQLVVTSAASRYVALNPVNFYGVKYMRLVSSNAQAADRVIQVMGAIPTL